MGRAPCCDKANVKKGPWSPEEDAKLKAYIEENGTGGNWIALPQKIGLKRCGKSCRLRWLNYLRPNIRHGGFSEEEDNIICSLYVSIGSRWSIIAAQLPGRTDNDIKNYWNTRLKKKLLGKQRKEQQAHARRVVSLKQEMKREIQNLSMATEGVMNPVPCWTVGYNPGVATPLTNVPNPDYDQTSLRNLLIKLGARFSVDNHHQQTYSSPNVASVTDWQYDHCDVNSFPQHQSYETRMNVANSLTEAHTASDCNSLSQSAFQGINDNVLNEMSHLSCTNPAQRDDALMERYFAMEAMDMVNGSSTMTSSTESGSWGDMSSLVYSPLESYYEACQQGMPQDFAFDDSRYLGLQQ